MTPLKVLLVSYYNALFSYHVSNNNFPTGLILLHPTVYIHKKGPSGRVNLIRSASYLQVSVLRLAGPSITPISIATDCLNSTSLSP